MPFPTFDNVGDVWNIGYGTTHYPDGKSIQKTDMAITEDQATQYLKYYVDVCTSRINKLITVTLSQWQFDALVSFAYNEGVEAFETSTLLKLINADSLNYDVITAEFKKWIYRTLNGEKIKSNGLLNRRTAEANMYCSAVYELH